MPVSKRRDKHIETPTSSASRVPVNLDSPRWLAPLMVTLLIVGLLDIVVFYIAGNEIPFMASLGNLANVGIGFGLMSAGFILSTRWR
jgi:hypothetical protein